MPNIDHVGPANAWLLPHACVRQGARRNGSRMSESNGQSYMPAAQPATQLIFIGIIKNY
jgi:hypothetical protein